MVVGTQGVQYRVAEAAQNAVLVQAGYGGEMGVYGCPRFGCIVFADHGRQGRVELCFEQCDESRCQRRLLFENLLHVGLREGQAGLQQPLGIGPQHHDFAPLQPGTQHQAVEAIGLRVSFHHGRQRRQQAGCVGVQRECATLPRLQFEVLYPARGIQLPQAIGALAQQFQPERFEQRQHVGYGYRLAAAEQLQPQQSRGIRTQSIRAPMPLVWRGDGSFQRGNVLHSIRCRAVFLISERKRTAVTRRQAERQGFRMVLQQSRAQPVGPGA